MSASPSPRSPDTLVLIPARGGSKGIARKNLHLLGGKPLIQWTIECALSVPECGKIVVTSDDPEILSFAESLVSGISLRRPAEFATDASPIIDTILHALDQNPQARHVVLLQPTSPLRIPADIRGALAMYAKTGRPCVSVCESPISPFLTFKLDRDARMSQVIEGASLVRRQELPQTYVLNGAVYVSSREDIAKNRGFFGPDTLGFVMPASRSEDIDTPDDLEHVEWLLSRRRDA